MECCLRNAEANVFHPGLPHPPGISAKYWGEGRLSETWKLQRFGSPVPLLRKPILSVLYQNEGGNQKLRKRPRYPGKREDRGGPSRRLGGRAVFTAANKEAPGKTSLDSKFDRTPDVSAWMRGGQIDRWGVWGRIRKSSQKTKRSN